MIIFFRFPYSHHAEIERKADELTFAQVEEALLNSQMLEEYPDTGRGEPRPPEFIDPWTRGGVEDETSAV